MPNCERDRCLEGRKDGDVGAVVAQKKHSCEFCGREHD